MASHLHCDPVVLPDGTTLWGSAHPIHGYERDEIPDFGLYLDSVWSPPWPRAHLCWPDLGVPDDIETLRHALDDILHRARRGQRTEIGCIAGHGRTGTALACLAVMAGLSEDPVHWIRAQYCHLAVETDEQADIARSFRP